MPALYVKKPQPSALFQHQQTSHKAHREDQPPHSKVPHRNDDQPIKKKKKPDFI